MPYITVFTPIYNREKTIERVYNSLLSQSFKDFEWVIVDDGSTDNSVKVIEKIISMNNSFSITFFENEHGGKHRAVNKGLQLAKGKLFFMLDSDDWLTDDALQTVVDWEKKIPQGEKCAGLCGCMQDPNGNLISIGLSKNYIFMPLTTMIKNGVSGDHADILFTDVFRNYPYPEIQGEYHIAPGVPFVRMANDGYNLMFFNDVIYVAEYGPDGLTAMGDKKSLDNFEGYSLRSRELLKSDIGCKRKLEILIKYNYLALRQKLNIKQVANKLDISISLVAIGRAIAKVYILLHRDGIRQ